MRRTSALSLTLLVVALALLPAPVEAQQDGPIYIVQEGDTLTGIALRFGSDVASLAAANGLSDPSAIFPGMRLRLPGFVEVSGVLTTRPVEPGESLASLSLRQRIAAASLSRLNRLVSPDRLYIGMPLIVPQDEEGDGGSGVRLTLPGRSGGPVGLAVEAGTNPWRIAALNTAQVRLWLLPGEPVYLPGADLALDAIPDGLGSLSLTPVRPGQGHTLSLRFQSGGAVTVGGSLGDRELNFVSDPAEPQASLALQGIHALAEPGLTDLRLVVEADGDRFALQQPIRIDSVDYGREILSVPAETVDPANTGPEDELVASVVGVVTPERRWSGPFQFPTTYFETFPSFFGTRRNYNNTGWKYYHTGLDLFGSSQTEILAPAPGVVAFAGPLTVRGNTTYLDHGWGVFTGYLHQSQILVEVGQRVETGQRIGMVGGTGRVTGPHLHWEIWVGGVPVEPLEWTSAPGWP